VRKATKLIEGGHRGFRTIGILLRFLRFFENPKSRDFLRFFALLRTFSRTMLPSHPVLLPVTGAGVSRWWGVRAKEIARHCMDGSLVDAD